MSNNAKDKIIVALDVETAAEARNHIAELSGQVGAFKIGLQLITAAGSGFVSEVVKGGNKLFLDTKFHDIPVTVAKAAVEVARLGVWMFNVHASGGSEMMKRAVAAVDEVCEKEGLAKPKVTGVTVLTSSNRETLGEIGFSREVEEQARLLAKLAYHSGLDGVVASPKETSLIRQAVGEKDFMIVTPGIRLERVENDDQKRVMTPREAIEAGADYLVIGRPILAADDKAEAIRKILQNIES